MLVYFVYKIVYNSSKLCNNSKLYDVNSQCCLLPVLNQNE